jgi:hypothetical protein
MWITVIITMRPYKTIVRNHNESYLQGNYLQMANIFSLLFSCITYLYVFRFLAIGKI